MALPIINSPEFEATIPSTGQKIFFRPFKVKEEKILYMALEGNDQNETINAIVNVLSACIVKGNVDIKKLAYFDIEYLFLKLRAKSVGEVVTLRFKHGDPNSECKHVQDVPINLDSIGLSKDPSHTDKVMLTETVGVKLKYPNLDTAKAMAGLDLQNVENVFAFLTDSVEYIFDKDNVFENTTREEIKEWLENLSQSQFDKIMQFFNTMPKLKHTIKYTCSKCGKEESLEVEGLQSFFA